MKSLEFGLDFKFKSSKRITQFIATLVASSFTFSAGNIIGWTAPVGLILKNPSTSPYKFTVSDEEFSYIASSMALGSAVCCIPAGLLMNKFGRKLTLLSTTIVNVVGWFFIIFANSIAMMITGRVFLGIALGFACVIVPVYIAEIAHKDIRGFLGSFFNIMLSLGVLFVYIVGAFDDIVWLSVACLLVPVIFGVLFMFMPETPIFLIGKGQKEQALKSLEWFRGLDYDVKEELSDLVAEENERLQSNYNRPLRKILRQRHILKSLIIVIGIGILLQASGIDMITFYVTEIFAEAKTNLSPQLQTIIFGLVQLSMGFVSALVVEKAGRIVLTVGSMIVICLSLISLGTHFYIKEIHQINLDWLPLTSLIVYVCVFSVGLGSVAWILLGEICGNEIKGFAVGTAMTTNWFFAFLVTKFFTNLIQLLKIGPTFWLFGILNFLGAFFVYYMIPETKGKSLAEIQAKLSK